MDEIERAGRYAGIDAREWRVRLDVPEVIALEHTGSTLDVAHRLAASGAAPGTVVVAERQTAGRGRAGKHWSSASDHGVWVTVIERPADAGAVDVLSIRVGLAVAAALDEFAEEPVRLKWPNDMYVREGKLAGTLVEARWRGERLDWVAIGLGVNVTAPADVPGAAGLEAGTTRAQVLGAVVPAIRAAAELRGELGPDELESYASRDLARGRRCSEPLAGSVAGISPRGELLIELADVTAAVRSGSLRLD